MITPIPHYPRLPARGSIFVHGFINFVAAVDSHDGRRHVCGHVHSDLRDALYCRLSIPGAKTYQGGTIHAAFWKVGGRIEPQTFFHPEGFGPDSPFTEAEIARRQAEHIASLKKAAAPRQRLWSDAALRSLVRAELRLSPAPPVKVSIFTGLTRAERAERDQLESIPREVALTEAQMARLRVLHGFGPERRIETNSRELARVKGDLYRLAQPKVFPTRRPTFSRRSQSSRALAA